MEAYSTVSSSAMAEFVEKRSKFISHVMPVKTEDEAQTFISGIRKEYWDATHNVYAYIIRDGNIVRFCDDNEPQGTAGMPILSVIQKRDLTDVAIVVTRYFGGTLLGAGGLVRAYGHSASIGLDAAGVHKMALCDLLQLTCEYSYYAKTLDLILLAGGTIDNTQFEKDIEISFSLPQGQFDSLKKGLTDMSRGEINILKIGAGYRRVK